MNEKPRQAKSIRAQLLDRHAGRGIRPLRPSPRESVLSERLGISRTQLRDILASAGREGFITRRHASASVINPPCLGGTGPHGH